jgi:hypothetical protein
MLPIPKKLNTKNHKTNELKLNAMIMQKTHKHLQKLIVSSLKFRRVTEV